MKKKTIALLLTAVMLLGTVVGGTLAYLMDSKSVVNTFTVGQVVITLDEAEVDKDGKPIDGEKRVTGNEYHLIPGQTYTKDPTVHMVAGSEEAYIRMLLKINCKNELDAIFAPDGIDLTKIFGGYDGETWIFKSETTEENTVTYEFRYRECVPGGENGLTLAPLFESFTIPGEITGEQLKTIESLKIEVEGHAIQAAGFENELDDAGDVVTSAEDAAWAAFDNQINK